MEHGCSGKGEVSRREVARRLRSTDETGDPKSDLRRRPIGTDRPQRAFTLGR